jgi:uncharacterized membrane protein
MLVHHETSIEIAAGADAIWSRLSDVERWPEWTRSVTKVERLDGGEVGVGNRARVKQPGMPALVWEVTDYAPETSFSWASKLPGVTTTGGHRLASGPGEAVTVTLTLDQEGFLAPVVWWLTGSRTRRYVQIEAEGLKRRSEAG